MKVTLVTRAPLLTGGVILEMAIFILMFFLCFMDKNVTRGNALLADILATVQHIKRDFHQILVITDSTPEMHPIEGNSTIYALVI